MSADRLRLINILLAIRSADPEQLADTPEERHQHELALWDIPLFWFACAGVIVEVIALF